MYHVIHDNAAKQLWLRTTSVQSYGTTNFFQLSLDDDNGKLFLEGSLKTTPFTSIPIYIGRYAAGNAEYIMVNDAAQLFDINTTTIKLSKGQASKWLALNANREIEYLDPPSSSGSVLSVGLLMPSQFAVTNSPVTTTGTLTAAWNNQNANRVFAGPTTGIAAAPTFRSLVASDIPALSYDNYSNWDIKITGGTTVGIYKTGSLSTYKGVSFIAGTGVSLTESSGVDGFYGITIAASSLGTVTSVGLVMPSQFTISNSPITTSGSITATWVAQAPNLVLAGPWNPLTSPAAPTFRYLTANDIPALPYDNFHSWDVEVGTLGARSIHTSGSADSYNRVRFIAGTGIELTESSLFGNAFGITIAAIEKQTINYGFASTANSTTSYITIPDMTITLDASSDYEIECIFQMSIATDSLGAKVKWIYSGTVSGTPQLNLFAGGGYTSITSIATVLPRNTASVTVCDGTSLVAPVSIHGHIRTGTAGTLSIQFAKVTSGTVYTLQGAILKITKLS